MENNLHVRHSLSWLVDSPRYEARPCASAKEFFAEYERDVPGCLVVDVSLPDMSCMELLAKLRAEHIQIPVVVISGYADVPLAVEAMKGGAFDFLEKPLDEEAFLRCISSAVEHDKRIRSESPEQVEFSKLINGLTDREQQVLDLVVSGWASKKIATELDLSVKTVEAHRLNVMRKTQSQSVAELVSRTLRARMASGEDRASSMQV